MSLIGPMLKPGERLPRAFGNCQCACHRTPGMVHVTACCSFSDEPIKESIIEQSVKNEFDKFPRC